MPGRIIMIICICLCCYLQIISFKMCNFTISNIEGLSVTYIHMYLFDCCQFYFGYLCRAKSCSFCYGWVTNSVPLGHFPSILHIFCCEGTLYTPLCVCLSVCPTFCVCSEYASCSGTPSRFFVLVNFQTLFYFPSYIACRFLCLIQTWNT